MTARAPMQSSHLRGTEPALSGASDKVVIAEGTIHGASADGSQLWFELMSRKFSSYFDIDPKDYNPIQSS